MTLLLKIAIRNVARQRRRSLLTCLGMTGGYVLCCLSFSLVEGSYNNAIDVFTLDHTGHIQIHKNDYLRRPNIHKSIDDVAAVESTLAGHPSIRSYSPRVFSPALAYTQNNTTPVQVIGVQPRYEAQTTRLEDKVQQGRYLAQSPNEDGYYDALIGRGAANLLRITPGDELILISRGADGSVANDIMIVSGIVGTLTSADRQNVYLPLQTAQRFLSMGTRVHQYALLLQGPGEARAVAASLQNKLPSLTVSPWQEVEETFYKSMQSDKKGNQFTLGIVIFIVFIGVLNTVLMSVLERTREFGVLKAIGSRPRIIAQMILLESSALATFSVVLGFVSSLPLVAWLTLSGIALQQPLDVGGIEFGFIQGEFSPYVFAMPAVIIIASAILVSIPPGVRAARILPRQALASH